MWVLHTALVLGLSVVWLALIRPGPRRRPEPAAIPLVSGRASRGPRSPRFGRSGRGGGGIEFVGLTRPSESWRRWTATRRASAETASAEGRSERARLGLCWRVYERLYARLHGLQDLVAGDRAYLRFAVTRYRRRSVRLLDGVVLRRGDRVVLLHLHNDALTRLGRELASPAKAGVAFRRVLNQGLATLAARLATDPTLADVRAVGALTYLWRGSPRLGFAVFPLRSRGWARLVAAYQRHLRRQHALPVAACATRRPAADREEARLIWISTPALVRRYGRAAMPVERRTAS